MHPTIHILSLKWLSTDEKKMEIIQNYFDKENQ
jgi:hypothetical protein